MKSVATDDYYFEGSNSGPVIIHNFRKNIENAVDTVKNNTVVLEGKFLTSRGMIVSAKQKGLCLRGTLRYRYLEPTKDAALKLGIYGIAMEDKSQDNFKHQHVKNKWYEQDINIYFINYYDDGYVKVQDIEQVSDVRPAE